MPTSKKRTRKVAERTRKPVSRATKTAKTAKKPAGRSNRAATTVPAAQPLSVEALRWRCDADTLPFASTADVEPVVGVIGQDAAVDALRFGLETRAPGQNIFVRGLSGTGRLTLVHRLLREIRPTCPATKDCCYVHNFSQPERPRLITLPARRGQDFRHRIDKLADFIRDDLSAALQSEGINARRRVLERNTQKRIQEFVKPFQDTLQKSGLTLVSFEAGPVVQTAIFPLEGGKAVPPEEFDQLHARGEIDDEHYQAVQESYLRFEQQLGEVNEKASEIRREHDEVVAELLEKGARSILLELIRGIQAAFPEPIVQTFLADLVDDVVQNHLQDVEEEADFTRLYRVNVVLEHKGEAGCPTIVENTPTMRNLLGTIDPEFEAGGEVRLTHMGIRAGSLLRADGGYLIVEDRDLLDEPHAWKVLKRALRTGRLEISLPDTAFTGWAPALKPEPIEISVKVVLIGDPDTYFILDEYDKDFPDLFKVLVDFGAEIARDEAGVNRYATVLSRIAAEEGLRPFDRTAVAALAEHGARIAARAGKLTARFGRLADIAREAAFIVDQDQREQVTGDDVRNAVRRGRHRADLPSQRFREYVADGTIRVETEGAVVGQINGLAVLQSGPITYGFPTRITATIGPGTAGVINIEGEAALSGAFHTKGFYILGGLLRFLLRPDHPLAFDASIAFEQSYGTIDGDSASGPEICCLLSALTDLPLRQDLAMTGAIDQVGHIMAVGAANEKIEGFFDACRDQGMSQPCGVIIPQANVGDLMLRHEVVDACAAGQFHVYAVQTVYEALELLTGTPAGERRRNGRYPQSTVLGIAIDRARAYWRMAAQPSPGARRRK